LVYRREAEIAARLTELGFEKVEIDPEGYRNESATGVA
jgi:PP-loop superfamily ATP-utilizing enzyme